MARKKPKRDERTLRERAEEAAAHWKVPCCFNGKPGHAVGSCHWCDAGGRAKLVCPDCLGAMPACRCMQIQLRAQADANASALAALRGAP